MQKYIVLKGVQIQKQSIFDGTAYFLGAIPWKQLLLCPRSSWSESVPLSWVSHEWIPSQHKARISHAVKLYIKNYYL